MERGGFALPLPAAIAFFYNRPVPTTLTPTTATPVTELHGVGPERAAQLGRLKLFTAGDLLLHRPARYEDRRHLLTILELQAGLSATTRGRIVAMGLKTYKRGAKSVFEFVLEDATGRLHCRWWQQRSDTLC